MRVRTWLATGGGRSLVLGALCGSAWVLSARPSTAQDEKFRTVRNAVPGRYIVVLKDEPMTASGTSARALGGRLAARHGGRVRRSFEAALRGFSVQMTEDQARRLSREPAVAYVQQSGLVRATQALPEISWGQDRIDQREGLDGRYDPPATGRGVHAYVIDSGIRADHQEFRDEAGRSRVGAGRNFAPARSADDTSDCLGHGTHVSGILGGRRYGVARDVVLHPVRIFGLETDACAGWAETDTVVAGIDWVVANLQRPAVANLSLQGGPQPALDDAVRAMIRAGIVVTVAAGNSSGLEEDSCAFSPSRVTEAITVGSTGRNDGESYFSFVGSCVDLHAPGEGILAAWYTAADRYAYLDGTSMATPHVAGVAAQFLERRPETLPGVVSLELYRASTVGAIIPGHFGFGHNRLLYTDAATDIPPVPDRYFCGDRAILRSSAAKLVVASLGYTAEQVSTVAAEFRATWGRPWFADAYTAIPAHQDYVEAAGILGISRGVSRPGGVYFDPNRATERSSFAVLMLRAAGYHDGVVRGIVSEYRNPAGQPARPPFFADSETAWSSHRDFVEAIGILGFADGRMGSDGRRYFDPMSLMTRSGAAKLMVKGEVGLTRAQADAMAIEFRHRPERGGRAFFLDSDGAVPDHRPFVEALGILGISTGAGQCLSSPQ